MSIWDDAELETSKAQTNKNIWTEAEMETPSGNAGMNTNVLRPSANKTEKPLYYTGEPLTGGVSDFNPVYKDIMTNNNLSREQKAQAIKERGEAERKQIDADKNKQLRNIWGRGTIGATLEGASMLPIFNIPYVGTGIGGALFGAGDAINQGKKFKDIAKEAGQGFLIGETVGAVPYVGKFAGKTKAGQAVINKAGNIAESVANTQVGKTIGNITNKTGEVLTKEKNIIRPSAIYNSFTAKNTQNQIKKEISDMITPETKATTISMAKQGKFWSKNIDDPLTRDINKADAELNSIIKEISKNPEIVNNPQALEAYEQRLGQKVNFPDEELTAKYYSKYYEALDKAGQYNNVGKDLELSNIMRSKGELKKSQLAQKADLPKELKEGIKQNPPEYEVLHNDVLQTQAKDIIENNPNSYGELLTKANNKDAELSALDFETARQTVSKLYQEGKIDEALNLTELISKKASEAGQAVQSLSMWSRTTPEGAVKYAEKMLKKYNQSQHKNLKLTAEQGKDIKNLAENIQKAPEGREKEVAIAKMQKYIYDLTPVSWNKKYDTYRYINMLLSPKSRFKDFFLTGLNSVDNAIDEVIANGIDRARRLLPNQKAAFNGLRPRTWFNGLKKGFNEGVEDIQLGINTSRSGEKGRYGLPKTQSFKHTPLNEIEKSPKGLLQAGENILAGGEKALNYTIQVPDRMFYEARYASSLADQMATAGVKKPTNEMIKQANKEALEAVYQDDSWVSRIGNGIRNLINEGTAGMERFFNMSENRLPRFGDFIMPFVTTPANIVNQGLKNTFGVVPGAIKLARAITPGEIRDAELLIAKNIKGLTPIGLGLGIGKGTINSNIGQDNYLENEITGIKPGSITIGNKAFSLKDYPQWRIPMEIGAGLQQGGLSQAIVNTGNSIAELSPLQSLGDLVNSFKPRYGQQLKGAEIANNIMRSQGINFLSQNIPFGGALGELRNDIDPYSRELYMPIGENLEEELQNTLSYTKNRLQNRLPVASTYLPKKYNSLGQPVMTNNNQNPLLRAGSEAFDFGIRNYNNNDLYNEIQNFKDSVKDTDYKGRTTIGFDKAKRTINVNGKSIKLNNEQYSDYSKDFSGIRANLYKSAINSEEYDFMSNEEKINYLNEIKNSADEAVKIRQFGHIPNKNFKKYTQYILNNYENLTE